MPRVNRSENRPSASVTMDVDTLRTLFKEEYSGPDDTFCRGLEICMDRLAALGISATFFVVGQDLEAEDARQILREMDRRGHEIASHSYHHPQGLCFMSRTEKEEEIRRTDEAIRSVLNKTPVGFRAPCWNIDAETLELLVGRGYRYDSSVFPTYFAALMKLAYRFRSGDTGGTVLGPAGISRAPREPYRPHPTQIWRRGTMPIVEFPIPTTPVLRFPCYGTLFFELGETPFRRMYNRIRRQPAPFIFQMHLSEWVDDQSGNLAKHLRPGQHRYVPKTLRMTRSDKLDGYLRFLRQLQSDYDLMTMAELADRTSEKFA